jgi:hypothetical protein
MLPQQIFHRRDGFYRRDAETQRSFGQIGDRSKVSPRGSLGKALSRFSLRLCVSAVIAASLSCGSTPTDPRTVIPGDALVYLETTDLERTLRAIIDNPKFEAAAASKPNFSALAGIKMSIAVTGFQATEEAVTEENAVAEFQPQFVAVAETNAWSWQTTSFIENQLGEFVNNAYGGEVLLERTPRKDGKFYVWTGQDGSKAYAFQQGSLVFFGNDESAIERCLAVRRGEAESIAGNSKITDPAERLAFGYVSPEGVGQIANIAGMSIAMSASEEAEVKSFVAGVLPQILRNSVKEITWTAMQTPDGIEDNVVATLDDESSRVFAETIVPAAASAIGMSEFVPSAAETSTRYLLRDPQVAWRSMVLTSQKKTDETSGALIAAFSGNVFEPYGIEEPELFLSSIGPQIMTIELAGERDDDAAAVVAAVKDAAKIRGSIAREVSFNRPPEKQFGADVWRSEDGEIAVAFIEDRVLSGDAETVIKCLEAKQARVTSEIAQRIATSDAAAVTVAVDTESTGKIVSLLSSSKNANERPTSFYKTETRFNRKGVERKTISAFGLIGWLITRLATE